MSTAAPTPPPASPRKNLYTRLTASVPLLVTVIVHVVLVAVAGYFFVSEHIITKKKNFEAANASENVVQKKVEHRLQVARKGGGSASSSPVSASRIFSTASSALQLPAMTELPLSGASTLSGMGFGAGMGAVGGGTGYNTGLGNGNGLGSGFMSMSFLGTTNMKASKVVFVVDVSAEMMDLRKGGFAAFQIVRTEIMKLINSLPPSAEFGVVLYSGSSKQGQVACFEPKLIPCTVANKTRFIAWMKRVNEDSDKIGINTIPNVVRWKPTPLPSAGLDPELDLPAWAEALRCGLEMQPDTIFQITSNGKGPRRNKSDAQLAKESTEVNRKKAELKAKGYDYDAIVAQEKAAVGKAAKQLQEIMARAKAKGKPLPPASLPRALQADYQQLLKGIGESLVVDKTGWADASGRSLVQGIGVLEWEDLPFTDLLTYIAQLQRALLKDRATINTFLFVGPTEMTTPGTKIVTDNLGKLCSRTGGKLSLITSKSLQEFEAKNATP